ncbi:MAG: TIGR04086 family membrane protein [Clostridia bacterium]|nr:TIGR04086 family membrane protein [Clostridia bacterium]
MLKSVQKPVNDGGIVQGLLFMLKTVLFSYIISLVLLFVAALFANYRSMSNMGISILANVVTAIGTLVAGFSAGRHFSGKGIFFGAGCGILYTVILCIAGNIVSGTVNLGISFLTALLIGVFCGAVGGIAGINTAHNRRR